MSLSKNIGDIDCDVVVGREWISLLRLVVDDDRPAAAVLQSRACSSPSIEGGTCHLPEGRNILLPDHGISNRIVSMQLLKEAPFGGSSTPPSWQLFDSNPEALHPRCVSHGITVVDQTDLQSALLSHVFTGSCVLGGSISEPSDCRAACTEVSHGIRSRDRLADIAGNWPGCIRCQSGAPKASFYVGRLQKWVC
ncbi:hypothetical protein EV363DRAFT_1209514 [Boletus edulis]|nr:hypothetical protein EV363DRAFT_1209514 [Boletus edulis]